MPAPFQIQFELGQQWRIWKPNQRELNKKYYWVSPICLGNKAKEFEASLENLGKRK